MSKDFLRTNTAKHYRSIRQILKNQPSIDTYSDSMSNEIYNMRDKGVNWFVMAILVTFIIVAMFMCQGCAQAAIPQYKTIEGYSINTWAEAIHHAEGNDNYGVLAHYKHTSYKQACINSVRHSYQIWIGHGRHGRFIDSLSCRYCPINCWNDNGTNKYWKDNVEFWLNKLVDK